MHASVCVPIQSESVSPFRLYRSYRLGAQEVQVSQGYCWPETYVHHQGAAVLPEEDKFQVSNVGYLEGTTPSKSPPALEHCELDHDVPSSSDDADFEVALSIITLHSSTD